MSDNYDVFYSITHPTIWQRLGYHHARAPRADGDELAEGFAPSWFMVETFIRLDWRDWLRLIFSKNLHIQCAIKTDKIIEKSRATSAIGVLPPGKVRAGG